MATANEIAARYAFRENEADSETTKAQRALFHAFQEAFARARPSRMARKQRDLSTTHPLHYLNITKRPFRRRKTEVLTLPADLQTLVNEQQADGSWKQTPGVMRVLQGNIGAVPRPPDGVSKWRWTTSLCIVYMQRQPEHFLALRKTFEKAGRWNEDLHLRKRARNALPPLPAYFYLPPDKVQARQWKEAQDELMATKGYVAFTNTIRDEVARQRARPSSGQSLASRRTGGSHRSRAAGPSSRSKAARPGTAASRPSRPHTAATTGSALSGMSHHDSKQEAARLSSLTPQQQHRQQEHMRMLEVEWRKAGDASSKLQVREEVRCFWRRKTRWGNPEYSATPHPARVKHVNDDGTVNVLFLNDGRETVNNIKRRYISRAGEHGFPAPGGVKPRYLKSRYEIMAERWGGGKSMQQEFKELRQICDAAAAPPAWDSRHSVTRGEYSTLPRHARKRHARERRLAATRRHARSRLPKPTDLPDTTLWLRQLDELASLSTVLQPQASPWQTTGVAHGAAATKLLRHMEAGGEEAEVALLTLTADARPPEEVAAAMAALAEASGQPGRRGARHLQTLALAHAHDVASPGRVSASPQSGWAGDAAAPTGDALVPAGRAAGGRAGQAAGDGLEPAGRAADEAAGEAAGEATGHALVPASRAAGGRAGQAAGAGAGGRTGSGMSSPTAAFTRSMAEAHAAAGSPHVATTAGGGAAAAQVAPDAHFAALRLSPVRRSPSPRGPTNSPQLRSPAMDSPSSGFGTGSSVATGRTSRGGADRELAVLKAMHEHEREVAKLLATVLDGAKEFRLAASYGQQNDAFTPTTNQLRVVRQKALELVARVRRWQRRALRKGNVGGIDVHARGLQRYIDIGHAPGTPAPDTKDVASRAASRNGSRPGSKPPSRGGHSTGGTGHAALTVDTSKDSGRPRTPPPRELLLASCQGTLPPPFYWNGQEVLVALASSLDFLATVPELVRAITQRNPR